MRILIIEDEITLNKTLTEGLKEFGFQSDVVETLKDGKYYLEIRNYDVVIVDLKLIYGNSIDIISDIKSKSRKTILIILSSINDDESEIEALRNGADDYIKKPFNTDVLVAKIEARLGFDRNNIIKIDDLIISPKDEIITYKEQKVTLRGKPFEVFTHLAHNRDQIISKEQLLHIIWQEPELVSPNVIDVAINEIRKNIDKPLGITTIERVFRRGYRFCFPKK